MFGINNFDLIIGTVGATLVLIAFLLRNNKQYGNGTQIYLLLNFFGAGFLLYYAYIGKAWPFVVLDLVWTINAAWGLIRRKTA